MTSIRPVVLGAAIFGLLSQPAAATGSITGALPAHARLIGSSHVPGFSNVTAVVYQSNRPYLALVQQILGADRTVWRHKLAAGTATLTAPGPNGLFQVVVRRRSSPASHIYAYDLRNGAVTSAIGGRPSGGLFGGEGITLGAHGFTVRAHDAAHKGSVPYRLVTRYSLSGSLYVPAPTTRVPDYPRAQYPMPNGTVRTVQHNLILLRLEIADTEAARETGLMNRTSLDPDSGMIFVWQQPVQESFWMENTYMPLTVAFLDAAGRIQEMQDMAPQTTTLHTPAQSYLYAIEVNQGFFAANGIRVGDTVHLHL